MQSQDVEGAVTETEDFVFFWRGYPSQWFPSKFVTKVTDDEEEAHEFNCAEQFMMAGKAKLFGDEEVFKKILTHPSPRDQKNFGRKVKGFKQDLWDAQCEEIVFRGNVAKFSQNPELKEKLLATGNKTLVEASPLDKVWGIGLAVEDSRVHDPKQWQGLNLLGKVLMRVRDELRKADGGQ